MAFPAVVVESAPMIQLQMLTLQRGRNRLLEKVDLTLFSGQKVGIIGANGSGKSSFFQLLLGHLHPDEGDLQMPPLRIAHMAQEVAALDRTALDYVLDGDQYWRAIQTRMAEAEAQDQHHDLGTLHADYEAIDGYTAVARAQRLLHGLGFAAQDYQRQVADFSGGWRIRLNLAQALMCPSDLLLLDEPTNHLDLDATLWLEQWLGAYDGTLLLISHDRDFLDRVVSHIAHFEQQSIQLYRGNYSAFELLRADRLSQQQSAFQKQQVRIAEIEQFVRRFKAKATKAKQAQSRVKELERMERIAPAHVDSPFTFSFADVGRMSDPLVTLDQACLGYNPDLPLLGPLSLGLHPEMRIGLLGANGAGKSTLIKSLVGEIALLSGRRQQGENLRVGYFAQHQLEALDLEASPLLHIQRISPKASEQQIRDFLGGFDFYGDAALERVAMFSGGEKARLALALITWQKPNLLLLDEPTNHLDLEVRHALTMALQSFPGALVLVSHDRHLLRNCVDQFLLVSDGKATLFDGDLDDYSRWLAERERQISDREARVNDAAEGRGESALDRKERKRIEAEKRSRLSPLRKQVATLEKELEAVQAILSGVEAQLADASIYEADHKAQLKQLLEQQGNATQRAEQLEEQWLEALEELEELSA